MMNALSWEVAAGAFASLLKASPKHELARSAQVNAAACYQELKQWDNAAQAHAAAISNYKPGEDQARLYYELAWAHREAGRPDDALKAFRELADGYPKDPLAADAFFHLAEAAYKVHADSEEKDRDAKKLDEARELYENVLAMPDVSRLLDKTLYRIGWCHWQQEQYKESAAAFDRLIDESPKSDLVPDALFQSGLAHSRLDDTKRAQERMQQLIEEPAHAKFPYRADALMVLSDCRVTSGDSEAALESLATYFSKHADHHDVARAQLLKGKALYALKRYDEAVAALEESTRLTRSAVAAEARFYIGQAHQIQSKFKDAVVAYLRIQALYASEREWAAAAAFESAKCYEAMGQKDAADAALRDVVRQYKGTQWAKLAAERLD
jgi:TolA-binding protein